MTKSRLGNNPLSKPVTNTENTVEKILGRQNAALIAALRLGLEGCDHEYERHLCIACKAFIRDEIKKQGGEVPNE